MLTSAYVDMEYHMKAALYSILAGILLICAAFLFVYYPHYFAKFTIVSMHLLTLNQLATCLLGVGIVLFATGSFRAVKHYPFQRVFADATVSTAYVSFQWRFLKVNRLLCELLDFHAHELVKMDFQRLIHPDDFNKNLSAIQNMLSNQLTTHRTKLRYLDKNGDLLMLDVTIQLAYDKVGKPVYFIFEFQKLPASYPHSASQYATVWQNNT